MKTERSFLTPLIVNGVHKYSHIDKWASAFHFYKCRCGNICTAQKSKVKSGHKKSCGCLRKYVQGELLKKVRASFPKGHDFNKSKRGKPNCNRGKICIYPEGSRKNKKGKGGGIVKGCKFYTPEQVDAMLGIYSAYHMKQRAGGSREGAGRKRTPGILG